MFPSALSLRSNDSARFLSTHVMENDPELAASKASHVTVDLLLWGATGIWNFYAPTAAEQALSLRMQRYWTNFAKTGDPNGPGLPRWPAYDSASGNLLVLDDATSATAGDFHGEQCKFLDTLPNIFPKCGALCRAPGLNRHIVP